MTKLNIAMAQINPTVGDIEGNAGLIAKYVERAKTELNADLIVFTELALTGYPPEDLLLRSSLERRIARALEALKLASHGCAMIIGYPEKESEKLYNMACVIADGDIVYRYAKQCLPNYQVFDEKRYFTPGTTAGVFEYRNIRFGVSICEDIWESGPCSQLQALGIDCLLNLNASPFHRGKQEEREKIVKDKARDLAVPVVYVNQVGGQDELVFDGASFACSKSGQVVLRCTPFVSELSSVVLDAETKELSHATDPHPVAAENSLASVYKALVLGVKDYVNKNRFKGTVLGLSGGIDSALTLAIAVDALGAERVQAVMMPFKYTSQMSRDDAQEEARRLGVKYHSIAIENIYESFMESLAPAFEGLPVDTTEQNIQARSRGVILMALSNKLGYLVLTTGNKSEMAVGYATLYGDMAGGLDVLKDVPKTLVYELAKYRNSLAEVIPENVITRPPSAELAPDQVDEDSLPPYSILDEILRLYIELDMSAVDIIAEGFDEEEVRQVLRLVDINEYKRRQAPIGIKITKRAFGRDRRYPITNGWQIGD